MILPAGFVPAHPIFAGPRRQNRKDQAMEQRLFIGTYPTGIVYADRAREVGGDYARLAFLPFRTLEVQWEPRCPPTLRSEITDHAATIQVRRGEQYEVSTSGQTVMLGGDVSADSCRKSHCTNRLMLGGAGLCAYHAAQESW